MAQAHTHQTRWMQCLKCVWNWRTPVPSATSSHNSPMILASLWPRPWPASVISGVWIDANFTTHQPARHRCFGGVWLTHGSSGWELGPLVGAQQSTSQKQTADARASPLRPRWEPRIFILISSLTGEDLLTKSSLMASASGPRLRLSFFLFLGGGKKYEKVLRKGVIGFCRWWMPIHFSARVASCIGSVSLDSIME